MMPINKDDHSSSTCLVCCLLHPIRFLRYPLSTTIHSLNRSIIELIRFFFHYHYPSLLLSIYLSLCFILYSHYNNQIIFDQSVIPIPNPRYRYRYRSMMDDGGCDVMVSIDCVLNGHRSSFNRIVTGHIESICVYGLSDIVMSIAACVRACVRRRRQRKNYSTPSNPSLHMWCN